MRDGQYFKVNQVYRSPKSNGKLNNATWEAHHQQDTYMWKVHFHADYVNSSDFEATSVEDMLLRINQDYKLWQEAVDKHWTALTSL